MQIFHTRTLDTAATALYEEISGWSRRPVCSPLQKASPAPPITPPRRPSLQVQGNTLTISGERSTTHETKEADYLRREITYGSFQRSILLPEGVDKDKLNAEYRNGILEITAPIATAALPRKVEIKALPSATAKHANA